MSEAPTTTRTANVWAWRRFLPRPAMVAAVVVVLLAASFVTQLDLMGYVGEIPVGIFIRLPILGFFAGAVLAFGPDWPMPPFAWPEGVRQPALTAAGVAAAVAAIVCALVSSKAQHGAQSPTLVTTAWVLGMALLLTAGAFRHPRRLLPWLRTRRRAWAMSGWGSALPAVILFLVVALAAALRLVALDTIPGFIHFDEAGTGIDARAIAEGQVSSIFSNGYGNLPTLGYAWDALPLKLLGDNLYSLRLSSALLGICSIVLVALLGKELFTWRAGLLAAFILAVAHYHIHYSRIAMPNIEALTAVLLTLYLLTRALKYGSRYAAVGAGIAVAVDLQVYFSARIAVLLIPGIIFYILVVCDRRLLRTRLPTLGWLGLSLVVSLLPVTTWIVADWQDFSERTREVLVLGGSPDTQNVVYNQIFGTHDPVYILRTNLWWAIQTFNYLGNTSNHYLSDYPFVDPVSAALLPAALCYSCFRPLRAAFAILTIPFMAIMILAGMLTIDQPDWDRLVLLSPLIALLIGGFLDALLRTVERLPRGAIAGTAACLAVLVAIAYGNIQFYFGQFEPRMRSEDIAVPGDAANYLRGIHDDAYAYSVTQAFYMDWLEIQYLAPQIAGCSVPTDADLARCPSVRAHDRIFFVSSDRMAMFARIKRQFPGGSTSILHTYGPGMYLYIYRVHT